MAKQTDNREVIPMLSLLAADTTQTHNKEQYFKNKK